MNFSAEILTNLFALEFAKINDLITIFFGVWTAGYSAKQRCQRSFAIGDIFRQKIYLCDKYVWRGHWFMSIGNISLHDKSYLFFFCVSLLYILSIHSMGTPFPLQTRLLWGKSMRNFVARNSWVFACLRARVDAATSIPQMKNGNVTVLFRFRGNEISFLRWISLSEMLVRYMAVFGVVPIVTRAHHHQQSDAISGGHTISLVSSEFNVECEKQSTRLAITASPPLSSLIQAYLPMHVPDVLYIQNINNRTISVLFVFGPIKSRWRRRRRNNSHEVFDEIT